MCAQPVVFAVLVSGVGDIFEPGWGHGGRRFGMLTDGHVHAQRRRGDDPTSGLKRHACKRRDIEAYDERVAKR